uniref:RPGRIP1 like n=1 Tax=Sinocyclocheilus anshuiensis TaxID=1608454 RepID=A0A671QRG2_9TELE
MMFARADETAGDIPVKDITVNPSGAATLPEALLSQNVRERQNVSKFSREELEDTFLRLQEENLTLKQHACEQEDKIRRMATKLIRLVEDRKQSEGGRDVEMEELQEKVQELEKQNEGLKRRLLAAKQQLQVQNRRHTPYSHIQPHINSSLRRLTDDMPMTASRPHTPKAGIRHVEGDMSAKPHQGLLPRYGHSLLDEVYAEIHNLENVIESQQAQMEEMERSAEMLRDQLKRKEREFEESLLQMRAHQASGQRLTLKDNMEMIKLQKLLSEKASTLTVLEGRFLQQRESMKTLKASHDAALVKVDEVSRQLKEERLKGLQLETQIQTRALDQRHTQELQERIQDLEKERDLLKENCDKLVCNSAFDVSQEQKWKTREQQLKLQVAQLETALKSDLADKNQILDKIKAERDLYEKLMQENKELQLRYLEQKQQLDEMKERMKFFTKVNEIDAAELSEALMLIKVRRSQKSGELGFLEKVEEDVKVDVERSLRELQATNAETIQELEKTRNMLIIQHKINKDYQAEVEAVTRAMDDLKLEHELKSEKLAQLLDMRAAKTKKLEAQLKDIAYGAKTHVFRPDVTSDDVTDEFDETLRLARGENLMEINLGRAQFSSEAIESLKDKDPSTFCTYAFYDFELQSTAVVRGAHPAYSLTSQYLVRVDDLFLNYLHSSSVTVEVQLAEGLSFRTVAAGQLRLNQLLEQGGKVFSTIQLVGVTDEIQVFGFLWNKPFAFKERVKALGYLNTSMSDSQVLSSSLMDGDLNELNVTIHSCCDLRSRGPHTQPSPYIFYKLYDFPDHDTPIISSTNEPQFEDHMVFPVAMNSDLDALLRSEALVLYVFDDLDVENQLYLGKGRVPLISLAHDKTITGMFELTDPEGLPSGQTIEITGRTTPERQTAQDKEKTQTETQPMTKDPPLIPQPTVSEVMASPKRLSIQDHTVHKSVLNAFCCFITVEYIYIYIYIYIYSLSDETLNRDVQGEDGDSDDCIVPAQSSQHKKQPSECIRVEIVTLSLNPGSRVAKDSGIVRLFVEYCFLGLPSVETPLSLKKPLPGHSVSYNFSNVIHVDKESNQPRRQTLRAVLEGRNKQLEHIKFTVVSDPPEEEEHDEECEDVGVAYLRILDITEKRTDMKDISLNIVDVQDSSEVIGHLVVTVKALEALTSIMKDPERDRPLTTLA